MSVLQLKIQDVCLQYAFYSNLIQDNAKLMCSDGNYSELCSERMSAFGKVEAELLDVIGQLNDVPKQVKEFIQAAKDNGCALCKLSSKKQDVHYDCQVKMERYFYKRAKLREWANQLLIDKASAIKRPMTVSEAYTSLQELLNNYNTIHRTGISYHTTHVNGQYDYGLPPTSFVFYDKDWHIEIDNSFNIVERNKPEDIEALMKYCVSYLMVIFGG